MKHVYELKWSVDDNPNAWIEPTTFCQFSCPSCYRGLGEKNHVKRHENLDELKKQVDWFVKNRNVQTISIAGGEPLLYPYIEELIEYISRKKLKSKIYTNGVTLNEEKLKKLKEKGATEFIIHVDKYQRKSKSEKLMNVIRQNYCNLFRKIGGLNLGFIMPISKANIVDLPVLAEFYQKNSDIVNLVVFTLMKEMLPNKILSKKLKITMNEVISAVQDAFGILYCAYLGKQITDEVSWLFSLSFYKEGNLLGSIDDKTYKKLQDRYYKKKKKYFITIRNKPIGILKLLPMAYNNKIRKILFNCVKYRGKSINAQVVLIINPPEHINKKWNICSGCPDAMLYNGKLVPSCLLERVKSGEEIFLN